MSATKSASVSTPISGSGTDYLELRDGAELVRLPILKATAAHRSYVLSTWVKSYVPVVRAGHACVPMDTFMEEEPRVAESLFSKVLVVSSENDPYAIHAWVCAEPGILHYTYVPPELRGKGVATALTHQYAGLTYQHGRRWPKQGAVSGGRHNPYLLGRRS